MEEAQILEELSKYEYIQYVVPDVNTIPRGKIVRGRFKEKVAKDGLEVGNSVCLVGPNSEFALSMFDVLGRHFPNGEMRPCLDTLTPWPWVGGKGEVPHVGNVICDLLLPDGSPDITSPRQLLKVQLDTLKNKHGLVIKSAFEYEFDVFKAGTTEPMGGGGGRNVGYCWDVRAWGRHHDLLSDFMDVLGAMGVEVSSLTPEMLPGQWEFTTDPLEGLRGGDAGFYVKNAVKGFFESRGYTATFMSRPAVDVAGGTGLHLNHSLWSVQGGRERNVLKDAGDPELLSPTARHWLAGLLTHAPALAALCCPTLNCYRRLFNMCTPSKIAWAVNDRNALIRVHTARDNVFFENRLPSGPCSPYLALAATVAAGLDGLDRALACPPAEHVQSGQQCAGPDLPKTLAQALDALEKDEELRGVLGERFVSCYVKMKRENEVQRLEKAGLTTEAQQIAFEREMYIEGL